jgi:hypothetical protein
VRRRARRRSCGWWPERNSPTGSATEQSADEARFRIAREGGAGDQHIIRKPQRTGKTAGHFPRETGRGRDHPVG